MDRIAAPALAKATLLLEHKVARVVSADDSARVTVELEGRPSMSFDQVVMTAPLGWLKQAHRRAFEPQLPMRMQQAIDSLGYGCLDKVIVTFPTAFWNEAAAVPVECPPTPPDAEDGPAPTTPAQEPPSPDSPSSNPGFLHWIAPEYAQGSNPAQWPQECVNLAALPPTHAEPTLLFYTFGDCSRHLTAALAASRNPTQTLLDFLRPYYSRLPGYSATAPACQPAAALATNWGRRRARRLRLVHQLPQGPRARRAGH